MKFKNKLLFLVLIINTLLLSQTEHSSEFPRTIAHIDIKSDYGVISVCEGSKTYGFLTYNDFFIVNKHSSEVIKHVTGESGYIFVYLRHSTLGSYLLMKRNPQEEFDALFFTEEGNVINEITGIETRSVEFSPDGNYLFMFRQSPLEDHHFRLFRVPSGEQINLPFSVDYPRFTAEFIDDDKLALVFFRQQEKTDNDSEVKTRRSRDSKISSRPQRGLPGRMEKTSNYDVLSSLLIIYDLADNTYSEKELTTEEGKPFIMNWDFYKKIIPLKDKFIILGNDKSLIPSSISNSNYALVLNTNGEFIDGININFGDCEYCGIDSFSKINDDKIILSYLGSNTSKLLDWNIPLNSFEEIYEQEKHNFFPLNGGFLDDKNDKLYLCLLGNDPALIIDYKNKTIVDEISDGIIIQGSGKLIYNNASSEIIKIKMNSGTE